MLRREVQSHTMNRKNGTWIKKCEFVEQYIGGTKSSEAWRSIQNLINSTIDKTCNNNISDQKWEKTF